MSATPAARLSSRRSILLAGSAGLAAGAANFAGHVAVAAVADPDPVIALIDKARQAEAALDVAIDEEEAAWLRWQRLGNARIPDALFHDPQRDWKAGFYGFRGTQLSDGRWWYGSADDLAYLRVPRLKQDWGLGKLSDDGMVCTYVPDPVGQARADEILAAAEEYQAERDRRLQDSGLTTASAVQKEARAAHQAARKAVSTARATSFEGVLAKMRLTLGAFEDDADLTSEIESVAGATDTEMSLSILRDLARLNGGWA